MHPDLIPRKTERARDALQQRHTLPRNQRSFLIMVDGRKSLRDLTEAAAQLGIDGPALTAMLDAGLLEWVRREVASDSFPAAPSTPATTRPPTRSPSLAATKLYAIDLAVLMLPGEDQALRESARQVVDAHGLRAWLAEVEARLVERAGTDRATLFMRKVGGMLSENSSIVAKVEMIPESSE